MAAADVSFFFSFPLGIARDFPALDTMPWELRRWEPWQQCIETIRSKARSSDDSNRGGGEGVIARLHVHQLVGSTVIVNN